MCVSTVSAIPVITSIGALTYFAAAAAAASSVVASFSYVDTSTVFSDFINFSVMNNFAS